MAYRLRNDEPVAAGFLRIALEQIDRSLSEVADRQMPRPEVVHEVRKRCKKIRGLLRLMRVAAPDIYRAEDDWFRDASAKLAGVREVDALGLALESLRSDGKHPLADEAVDRVRDALTGCHQRTGDEANIEARLAEFAHSMQEARQRVERWPEHCIPSAKGNAAIIDGFRKAYRRGRRALELAERVQADEYLHEFRKWAKYYWHHVNLLEPLSPKKLRRRARRLAELSDWLGDDRDLGALRYRLLEQLKAADQTPVGRALAAHPDEVKQVVAALDDRRGRLRAKAFRLGKRLYAKRPKSYARQLGKKVGFPSGQGKKGTPEDGSGQGGIL